MSLPETSVAAATPPPAPAAVVSVVLSTHSLSVYYGTSLAAQGRLDRNPAEPDHRG